MNATHSYPTSRRLRVAAAIPLAAAMMAAGANTASAIVHQAHFFTFYATIGGCFSTRGEVNTLTHVAWYTAAGTLKGSSAKMSSSGGYVTPDDGCAGAPIKAGDSISVWTASVGGSFTVPVLTVSFDRVSYHVSGKAPAGSVLAIAASRRRDSVWCDAIAKSHPDGTYSINVQGILGGPGCPPDYTPIGGDIAFVTWTDAWHDNVSLKGTAPFLEVTPGSSRVTGSATPGEPVNLQVRGPHGVLLGTAHGKAHADGGFALVIRDATGHSFDIAAGDKVAGNWAGNVALVVPVTEVTLQSGRWYGWCMPNAPYDAQLDAGIGHSGSQGITDQNGRTGTLFTQGGGIWTLTLTCRTAFGDRLVTSRVVS